MRVFTLLSKSNPASLIKYAGYIEIPQGIWPYTTIIAHEKGHYDAWQNHIYASNVSLDNDNDGVDDQWEPLHHLLNTTDDTTGAYISLNINGDTPDNEVIADIPALGTLFANKAFWKLDWAGVGKLADRTTVSPGGLQWGTMTNYTSTANSSDLYVKFYPVNGGTQRTNWTYASPIQIFTLADLQNNIPTYVGGTVLTSLP